MKEKQYFEKLLFSSKSWLRQIPIVPICSVGPEYTERDTMRHDTLMTSDIVDWGCFCYAIDCPSYVLLCSCIGILIELKGKSDFCYSVNSNFVCFDFEEHSILAMLGMFLSFEQTLDHHCTRSLAQFQNHCKLCC